MLGSLLTAMLLIAEPVELPKEAAYKIMVDTQFVLTDVGENWVAETGDVPSGILVGDEAIEGIRNDESAMGPNARRVRFSSELPPIAAGKLQIFLIDFDGETLLVIQNGLESAYHYRAMISRNGENRPTDVCQIFPNDRTVEHWPYAMDALIIYELSPSQVREDGRPICR